MAIALITGTTVAGYLVVRADHTNVGAAFAAASLPGSRAMTVLEQARQQMIVMDTASHTMHRVGAPKLASTASAISATTGSATPTGGAAGGTTVNFAAPESGHRAVHRLQHDVVVRLRPEDPVRLPE